MSEKVERLVRKKRANSHLNGLKSLARGLNALDDQTVDPRHKTGVKIWPIVKEIVTLGMNPKTLSTACKHFSIYAELYPVVFEVHTLTGDPSPGIDLRAIGEPDHAVWLLWNDYFHDQGWTRLKQCPVCQKWFVDITKNKSMTRCSSACTWKWWSRDRRKKVQTKRRKHHGRKT